jgi:hypothetical protein
VDEWLATEKGRAAKKVRRHWVGVCVALGLCTEGKCTKDVRVFVSRCHEEYVGKGKMFKALGKLEQGKSSVATWA